MLIISVAKSLMVIKSLMVVMVVKVVKIIKDIIDVLTYAIKSLMSKRLRRFYDD